MPGFERIIGPNDILPPAVGPNQPVVFSQVREVLTAARTYYVRSDGSNSNSGLADSASGAFLTIAKALSVAASLDCSIFQLTIQIGAATWTEVINLPRMIFSLRPILTGIGSTTIIDPGAVNSSIVNDGATPWQVNNLKVANAGLACLNALNGGIISFSGIEFGAASTFHIFAQANSSIVATGSYSISGNAVIHMQPNGYVFVSGVTVTITGTPAITIYAVAQSCGFLSAASLTFVGTFVGKRYSALDNGVIFVNGAGANYFPGTIAGTTATGGIYS